MSLTSGIQGDKPFKDHGVSSARLCICPKDVLGIFILIPPKPYFISISLEPGYT